MRAGQARPGLESLALRWADAQAVRKLAANTVKARWQDLAALAELLVPVDDAERDQALERAGELVEGRSDAELVDRQIVLRSLSALAGVSVELLSDEDALSAAFGRFATGRAATTVRRALSTWRSFCSWLVRQGVLASNPIERIDGPRRPDWQPHALSLADLERLSAAVDGRLPSRARSSWPARDRAVFALLVMGGLRASELVGLRIADLRGLDADPPVLAVLGKGGRPRSVPLPGEAVGALRAYLEERSARMGRDGHGEQLFVRSDGRRLTRSALDWLVRRWAAEAAVPLPHGAAAHALRHSYATLLLQGGANVVEVQELLGHRSLATTQVYVRAAGLTAAEAARANPARRLLGGR